MEDRMLDRMSRITLVALVAVSLGGVSVARADDAHADNSAVDSKAELTSAAVAVPAPSWPLAIRDRSLTLPQGMWSAGLGVGANNDLTSVDVTATGLWGLSYGVSDELTVGVSYGLAVEPSSEGRGPVSVNAAYTYYAEGALSLIATASAGYDLTGDTLEPLSLGTLVWYNIGDAFTLFTPGGQLAVGLEDPSAIGLSLPVSLGYQVNPHMFVSGDTSLGDLALRDGDSSVLGADVIPAGATAWYSPSNKMDVALSVSTDLKNSPGDSLAFSLLFIYYGGV